MADDHDAPRTITVSGTGTVEATPDRATFSAGVVSVSQTAAGALSENSAAIAKVIDGLKAAGVSAGSIRTEQVNLSPNFERPQARSGEPEIVGYTARNMISIAVDDVAALGKLLDAAARLGANQFGGISFSVSEPEPLLDKARQAAVTEALRLAALYAAAAGVEVSRVIAIREADHHGGPPVMMQRSAQASAVPIEPGTTTLSASVSVVVEIK